MNRPAVYLYERTGGGWSCSSCPLLGVRKEHVCSDPVGLGRHMLQHQKNGHIVPEWTLEHVTAYERLLRKNASVTGGPQRPRPRTA